MSTVQSRRPETPMRPNGRAMSGEAKVNGQARAIGRALPNGRPMFNDRPVPNGRSVPDRHGRTNGPVKADGLANPRGQVPPSGVVVPGESPKPGGDAKPEAEILFQKYFKSVGPRTYAVQMKRAGNGNHFLVLTEGKRDDKTGDVRKTRLFLFSEDFVPFFRMLHETAQFIKANPVSDEVRKKRERFWAKNREGGNDAGATRRSRAPRVSATTG